eukprot:3104874-Prymnesium_polylepis.1
MLRSCQLQASKLRRRGGTVPCRIGISTAEGLSWVNDAGVRKSWNDLSRVVLRASESSQSLCLTAGGSSTKRTDASSFGRVFRSSERRSYTFQVAFQRPDEFVAVVAALEEMLAARTSHPPLRVDVVSCVAKELSGDDSDLRTELKATPAPAI